MSLFVSSLAFLIIGLILLLLSERLPGIFCCDFLEEGFSRADLLLCQLGRSGSLHFDVQILLITLNQFL